MYHMKGGLLILAAPDSKVNEPKVQNAKALLIKVATSLFAEKGYAGTSVREIVEQAGVTKPVLYYYFENKEGLFLAILEEAYSRLDVLLEEQPKSRGNFQDRIAAFSRQLYELGMGYMELNRMVQSLMFGPPKGAPALDFDRYRKRILHTVQAIYEASLAKNEVKPSDPEEVAFLFLGLLSFCFNLDCLHPETADPERPVRLLRMAFSGLENQTLNPDPCPPHRPLPHDLGGEPW
jgi:TetR/AcrR family transcriptional regulator